MGLSLFETRHVLRLGGGSLKENLNGERPPYCGQEVL